MAHAGLNRYLQLSICEVTQEHRANDVLVTIADDVEDIATLQCAELLAARRPYSDVEWRELTSTTFRRLEESENEALRLRSTQVAFSTWLHQQLDRAMHRVEATDAATTRLPIAQARLRDIEAIQRYWQRLIDPPSKGRRGGRSRRSSARLLQPIRQQAPCCLPPVLPCPHEVHRHAGT